MAVIYQIKSFPDSSPVAGWVGIDAFREANYGNYAPYSGLALDLTGVTNPPPNAVLWGVLFSGAQGETINLNIPINSGVVCRIETYHLIPSSAGGSLDYNVAVRCDGATKASFTRTNQENKIFQTSFIYKTVDSNLDLDFVPDAGRYAGFSAVRISEALKAKFKVSNANPQKGETVTITDESVNELGATKSWTLNGSPISQSQIDAGLSFGSSGTRTLELTLSDGTNSVSFSRSFYVGDLVGASTIAKGTTAQYSESGITNPKYSIQGSLNTVSPNENYIDASGILHANKAENINIQARAEIWTTLNNGAVSLPNNDLIHGTSNTFDDVQTNIYLKNDGDFVEFEIPAVNDIYNSSIGMRGALYEAIRVFLSGAVVRHETAELLGTFVPVVGKKIKFVRTLIGYDVFYDSVYVCSNNVRPTAGWDFNANGAYFRIGLYYQNVPLLIKKPNFLSSTVPEKFATKSVAVYETAVANFLLNSYEIAYGGAITTNNTSTGTIATRVWKIGSDVLGTNLNISFTRPPGTYQLDLILTDGYGGTSTKSRTFKVLNPPPVVTDVSPLQFAQVGQSYQYQFHVSGGSGNGIWELAYQGNLPPNALNNAGLLAISPVGEDNYSFIVRWVDADSQTFTKSFSIPVTDLAIWTFGYDLPLSDREYSKEVRIYRPREGKRQTRVLRPKKRKLELKLEYFDPNDWDAILAFWDEHYPSKDFMFYDYANREYFQAWITSNLKQTEGRGQGDIGLTIEEV